MNLRERHFSAFAQNCYQFYRSQFRFRWPIYDVWSHFINQDSRKLYKLNRIDTFLTPQEQTVIWELREKGISIVQFNDLLPGLSFSKIQEWAEGLVQTRECQQRIKIIEGGRRPKAKSDKFYIVRPLGNLPVLDLTDTVMEMTLSEPILRIVSSYLGVLSRLTAVDLWYNVAVDGPDEFSQRWHRDPEDRKIVKTFLYLRDVGETNGPFCYVPGTQNPGPFRQKIGRANYPKDGWVARKYPANLRQVCTGKAGTLIFCDTTGFHKGGHPTAGPRFVFNAVYATNASEPLQNALGLFSLKPAYRDVKSAVAKYAIGHVTKQ